MEGQQNSKLIPLPPPPPPADECGSHGETSFSMIEIRSKIPGICSGNGGTGFAQLDNQHILFKHFYQVFLTTEEPFKLLPVLVLHGLVCAQSTTFGKDFASHISEKLIDLEVEPVHLCLKMRGFWLLGELLRQDYDTYIVNLLKHLNVKQLLGEVLFLCSEFKIPEEFVEEFQAIFKFWEMHAPEDVVEHVRSLCETSPTLNYVTNSDKSYTSCEDFYRRNEAHLRKLPGPPTCSLSEIWTAVKSMERKILNGAALIANDERKHELDEDFKKTLGQEKPLPETLIQVRERISQFCTRRKSKKTLSDLEKYYIHFHSTFDDFLCAKNPSGLLHLLVISAVVCAQDEEFGRKIANLITAKMTNQTRGPSSLKMRGLWLVGELLRKEYNTFVQKRLLVPLNVPKLLEDFFAICYVTPPFVSELQAIYKFWQVSAPKPIVKTLTMVCKIPTLLRVNKTSSLYTCEEYYQQFGQDRPMPDQTVGRVPLEISPREEGAELSEEACRVSEAEDEKVECIKRALLITLGNLIRAPSTSVPKAVEGILHLFLLQGNQEPISGILSRLFVEFAENMSEPNSTVRVLWVVGLLYSPENTSRLRMVHSTLDNQAVIKMFLTLLTKITEDAHDEMRAIYLFWTSIMSPELTSEVSKISSSVEYSWLLLDNEEEVKIIGMEGFYGHKIDPPRRPVVRKSRARKGRQRRKHSPSPISKEGDTLDMANSSNPGDKRSKTYGKRSKSIGNGSPSSCTGGSPEIIDVTGAGDPESVEVSPETTQSDEEDASKDEGVTQDENANDCTTSVTEFVGSLLDDSVNTEWDTVRNKGSGGESRVLSITDY